MSRSYKKNPICKDSTKSSKKNKQIANRIVRRRYKNAQNEIDTNARGSYKKMYESWDIHDYITRWTERDAVESWNEEKTHAMSLSIPVEQYGWHKKFGTLENYLKWWKRTYYKK